MNKSRSYILPLVLYDYQKYTKELLDNLINTYIKYEDKNYVLILEIKKDNLSDKFFEYYEYLPNFVKSFDYNENSKIILLTIPSDIKEDYDKFIEGKYSKISEESKAKIIKFTSIHFPLDLHDTIGKVVYRDPELEKQWIEYLNIVEIPDNVELSSKIDIVKETFYYE